MVMIEASPLALLCLLQKWFRKKGVKRKIEVKGQNLLTLDIMTFEWLH